MFPICFYPFFFIKKINIKIYIFYIILWIPPPLPPGGFAGDGHPVSSGQPTARAVQDTGWNR